MFSYPMRASFPHPKDPKDKKLWEQYLNRLAKHHVTYLANQYGDNTTWEMVNANLSMCFSCGGFGFWVFGSLVWPVIQTIVEPHADMPDDVKLDFVEASSIVDLSPRGSAALSRLALQKLMVDLGEKGKNINEDIASLVSKGLETEIQQALDIVRVVGNNAVHPGEINLHDDKAIATTLLQLINLVVDRRISAQKRIAEMFRSLPPGALKQIEERDAAKILQNQGHASNGNDK